MAESINIILDQGANSVDVVSNTEQPTVEVVITGGIIGGGSDKNFVFTQSSASDTWTINHTLDKFPSVSVVDSGGTAVIGNITYNSTSQITLTFSASFSGKAYLN